MATPESVRIYTVDENDISIRDILVRVYDADDQFITQAYTYPYSGPYSYAPFTLDGDDPPIEYTIRMNYTLMLFDGSLGDQNESPQKIEVYSPAAVAPSGNNHFEVVGKKVPMPESTDENLCRISGVFMDIGGRPLVNHRMSISPWNHNIDDPFKNPMAILLQSASPVPPYSDTNTTEVGIVGGSIIVRTDDLGFVDFELYRTGRYIVEHQNIEAIPLEFIVPDSSAALASDVLFPHIGRVFLDSPNMAGNVTTVSLGSYVDMDVLLLPGTEVFSIGDYPTYTFGNARSNVDIIETADPPTNKVHMEWISDSQIRIFGDQLGNAGIGAILTLEAPQVVYRSLFPSISLRNVYLRPRTYTDFYNHIITVV